jgi:hypothetical protein
MQVINGHVVFDLDSAKPEWISAPPIHSALAPDGAPIAGLSRKAAYDRVLIAERIRYDVHASPEQLSKRGAGARQLLERAVGRNPRERRMRVTVRSE